MKNLGIIVLLFFMHSMIYSMQNDDKEEVDYKQEVIDVPSLLEACRCIAKSNPTLSFSHSRITIKKEVVFFTIIFKNTQRNKIKFLLNSQTCVLNLKKKK